MSTHLIKGCSHNDVGEAVLTDGVHSKCNALTTVTCCGGLNKLLTGNLRCEGYNRGSTKRCLTKLTSANSLKVQLNQANHSGSDLNKINFALADLS